MSSCFVSGSASQAIIIKETTAGQVPSITVGDTTVVPFISNSLNLTRGLLEDSTLRDDRQKRFLRHGNNEISGDIAVSYAHTNFDTLLEGLFRDEFNANSISVGNTSLPCTIEIGDSEKNVYRVFKGCEVNSYSMTVNLDGIVESSFNIMGRGMDANTTSIDAEPTEADNTKQPFVHFDGSVTVDGNDAAGIITSVSISMSNSVELNYALGNKDAVCVTSPMVDLTGEITVYYKDQTLLQKFLNEETSNLVIVLDDGNGNTHTWNIPKIKYTGGTIDVSSAGAVPLSLPFTALYDDGISSVASLTRSA